MKTMILFALLQLIFAARVNAQDDISKLPGYIDFGNLEEFYESEDEVTEVNIEGGLMNIVAKAAKGKDPELSRILNNLKSIRVFSFEINNKKEKDLRSRMNSLSKKLIDENWERIVKVKDKGQHVNVYVKNNKDVISGVTVLTMDTHGEAVFVNIVGDIDLEAISKLGEKFDIPELNNFSKKNR